MSNLEDNLSLTKEEAAKVKLFVALAEDRKWQDAKVAYSHLLPETQKYVNSNKHYKDLLLALSFSSL